MTPEPSQRAYSVFQAALKCDPSRRAALLDKLCGGDPQVRVLVERMLAQNAEAERKHFLPISTSADQDVPQSEESTDDKSLFYWSQRTYGTTADAPTSPATLKPFLTQHPDYVISHELGRGGMGVVYLAENRLMGRKEVLKVVSRELMTRGGVPDRFLREIRNAARLRHANIVAAYSAIRDGENIVFAMEYIDGFDLGRLVESQGPLPVAHACNFIYQAAQGLQYAHEQGMVHRDIKPSNLILARERNKPVVKVLDFGLAKATREGAVDADLTRDGQLLGTPAYIAPEQAADAKKADIRADIYSLGCTLYYLLSGGPPFHGVSLFEVLQAHHSTKPRALDRVRPEVPSELAAVVEKMLAKEPQRRYQTPAEVAGALKPFFKAGTGGVSASISRREASHGGDSAATRRIAGARPEPTTQPPRKKLAAARTQSEPASIPRSRFEQTAPAWEAASEDAGHGRANSTWAWRLGVVGIVLLGLGAALAAWLTNIKTPNGVLIVENVPDNCVIEIDGAKKNVTRNQGGLVEVEAPPGIHVVSVLRGNIAVLQKRITLESAKASRLIVPKAPAPPPDDAVIVLENVPSDAVVEVDGNKVELRPIAGEPLALKTKPGRHVVVVKQKDGVLLAETVPLQSGEKRKLPVPTKERSPNPAPPSIPSAPPAIALQPADKPAIPLPKIDLVPIEGGEFPMGSPEDDEDLPTEEKPQRKVWVRPFFLGKTEVTQEQYQAVTARNPSFFAATGPGRLEVGAQSTSSHPVENVSWYEAILFCNALSAREGLAPYYRLENYRLENGVETATDVQIPDSTGHGYRLPTEAEWECACRAGNTARYFFGDDLSKLAQYAWFSENGGLMPHRVGERRPNDWGLFDMYGNVAEWCWDGFADYDPAAVANPQGPTGLSDRVIRGGSWRMKAESCRPEARAPMKRSDRDRRVGFRVARYAASR